MFFSQSFSSHSILLVKETLIVGRTFFPFLSRRCFCLSSRRNFESASPSVRLFAQNHEETSPISGLEDAFLGYIFGKRKATEVAHVVWQRVVRKGDAVVDATCGNGHDTLALLKMVTDELGRGCVYGMDIQNCALENTSSLLDESLKPNERKLVKLFLLCHSRMEDIVPKGALVRLVAFNLGYLPGGDKSIITLSERTLQALQSASRLLESGGLISVTVYLGHPGGREEYVMVQAFASGLPVENWVCCKFEMVNRPLAPVLIFLFKK